MKIRSANKGRKIIELPFSPIINYVNNDEETLISVSPLEEDTMISLDCRFSFFGDIVRFRVVSSNDDYRRIKFGKGIVAQDVSISRSVFLEFQFDGENFLPLGGGSNGLKIGDVIKDSQIGALIYTDRSNLMKQDSTNLYWNEKKKFLSIGHDSPTNTLDIAGIRRQVKISSLSPRDEESSIEFGIYGESSRWILGAFGQDLNDFCLKDLKTGRIWKLNTEEITKNKK